ncbi:MAG: phosphate ABC transporter substrate-binding protein PstS family protein [Alphaproteobacteria bacterium]|nr:phosphate ABC transporter substrate-binding protein PstS family protein [Alphaproteobacteria bacterium]
MKKLILCGVATLALAACDQNASKGGSEAANSAPAASGQVVLIDGSSTVYPISEALGEEFQKSSGTKVTAGLSGTGGGFKKFCRGETDISGASRPIKKEEIELCKQNGVEYIELPVALDALAVIVNPDNAFVDCMTVAELKTIWQPGAQGKVTTWKQVRASWPNEPLKLFGAGTDSGTFDYFTAAINGKEHESRGDYTATEDDNVTITGVSGDKDALGYLGLAYVTENAGKVKPVPIRQADGKCVLPSVQAARDATYQPLSRPLFYYVNKKYADERPHVREFIKFAFNPAESEKLVGEVGYVPLPAEAYTLALAKFDARKTGTYFGGGSKIGVTMQELLSDAANAGPAATK